ncbi:Acyl-protein synthetase, LuxE [Parafilimonas terrae]|uniref:Acyl-protein synthetase, LuxE n=1 Tax=Parafilimonas terrae TaxID=1465490 RepID=A0A1I5VX42_9BACT|nr:Acyl-protein synthetase, LuxE [Parafilimonas terrae]
MSTSFVNKIFQVKKNFTGLALELFHYQHKQNTVYKSWCDCLGIDINNILSIQNIPFLPISFFKTHKVLTGNEAYELFFESSGTTQTNKSRHYIKDINVYTESFTRGFELFYGDIKEWFIIGLLPSYLQQQHSSLIKMVDELIKRSGHAESGFYLDEVEKLYRVLQQLEQRQQKTLLIGVTYALLDFAEQYSTQLSSITIMETGGMKGRRREITREEVHAILKDRFNLQQVHSEYGMSELLSQAYAKAGGIFSCPPWMKVLVRDEDDPLLIKTRGKGAFNIIDLANVNSCAFIATDDVGEVFEDGSFSVAGRMDGSDIRGCSLMVL